MTGPVASFPTVVDNTMRTDFVICVHRWFRRYCQGLRHAGISSIHPHFGQCYARGLETSRRAYALGASSEQALLRGCTALIREWGDVWPTHEVEALPASASRKTLPACIDAHASYFIEYPLETDRIRILDVGSGPLVEVSFAVPIPGTRHPVTGEPIIYAGRVDMVGNIGWPVWVLDDKSASQLGESWAAQWNLDSQPTGYCWGLRQYGIKPIGAIIRGAGILSRNITFAESIQPRSPWQIEQWLRQLCDDIQRMLSYWERYQRALDGEAFPRALSKSACYEFKHPCQFDPLCSSPEPDAWLSEYVVDWWDPLRERDVA